MLPAKDGFPPAYFDGKSPESVRDYIQTEHSSLLGFMLWLLRDADVGSLRSSDAILGDLVVEYRDLNQRVTTRIHQLVGGETGALPEDQA